MMRYHLVRPEKLQGTIRLPASKSISNRALILHALSGGNIRPRNLSDCDDTRVMIEALEQNPQVIDIQAAGTAMRFLTAYLSVTPGEHVLTGTERMKQRPIRILVDALRQLGAQITYTEQEGFPPLRIEGKPLRGGFLTLPGNVSSQYISALLMIGACLSDGLELELTGSLVSLPYINLTLQLMKAYGGRAEWTTPHHLKVYPATYLDSPFLVESDWSAASYWYEMMALAPQGDITLQGLFRESQQGDCRGARLFEKLGIDTEFADEGVRLFKQSQPATSIEADLVDIPDLAQTFVVTCCLLGTHFRFTGLQSLKIKETDRIEALITEMAKLGYVVRQEHDDSLLWEGQRCEASLQPIATYQDHRMAMSFAPACWTFPAIRIEDTEVVSKSYPGFWDDLKQVGFTLTPY